MLTVLYRTASGSEMIYPAACVEFNTRETDDGASHEIFIHREHPLGRSFILPIEKPNGAAFVMNDAGTTVTSYVADKLYR